MAQNVRAMVSRFFSIPFILAGIAVVFLGSRSIWNGKASQGWPTTQGVILSSKVDYQESPKMGKTYEAVISYKFTVDGQVHTSSRVAYDSNLSDPAVAEGLVKKYPQGAEVAVYYAPNNPEVSVLEPGISRGVLMIPVFGFVCFSMGMAMFVFLPRFGVR